MKKKLLIILSILVIFTFVGCNKTDPKYDNKVKVNIEVANYGTISIEVYPDVAPITVENFLSLVKSGFYNGTTFHRIMKGFMIQGGAPNGNIYGGSGKTIKGEFKLNNFENNLSHERGTVSMARADSDPNSASSQFFIMQETKTSIDGIYAAFGRVTKGMEIVDQICENTKVEDSNGTTLEENRPVITRMYVVE